MKYIVLKREDIPDCVCDELIAVIGMYMKNRFDKGKSSNNTYFVINTDEPYADEIREIIRRERGECEV